MSGRGRFDASAPLPEDGASGASGRWREAGPADADAGLDQALSAVDDAVAGFEEGPLDETTRVLLESISGADDAPFTWRSLHDRVHAGRLTWQSFWLAPEEEVDGMRLVGAVLRAQTAASGDLLARVRAEMERQRR